VLDFSIVLESDQRIGRHQRYDTRRLGVGVDRRAVRGEPGLHPSDVAAAPLDDDANRARRRLTRGAPNGRVQFGVTHVPGAGGGGTRGDEQREDKMKYEHW
jgi:hypothetical protein